VLKEGIKYAGQVYWHPELAVLVGEDVLVRAAPSYTAPDELEVFFQEHWRCTVLSLSSEAGQAVSRSVVAGAQRRQRAHARHRLNAARELLETAEPSSVRKRQTGQRAASALDTPAALSPPSRAEDLFDFLVEKASNQKGHSDDPRTR